MANIMDGGGSGGAFSGFSSGVSNIAKSVGSTARKSTRRKRKSSFSGASRGVSNIARTVGTAGRRASRGYSRSTQASRMAARPRPATGSTRSGMVTTTSPPPPITPKRLSDNEVLAKDTTYQGQNASYQKALQDYAAQYAAEKAKYTGEYDATRKQYGLDQKQGADDLLNDYASRGLAQSGLYADALGDYTNDWNTKYADLDRARTAYFGDLDTSKNNFSTDQAEQLKLAKQQAIQRYLDSLK